MCPFQHGCFYWKLHSSLKFLGKKYSLQNTIPLEVLQHSLWEICSLQIIISLEVLQHYFWETCLFQDAFFNCKLHSSLIFCCEQMYYKTQYSLKCCSILFGFFETYMPFSRCLLQAGNALLFEIRYNSFLGNVYNFVWKSFFITIQIVPWSVAAIVLKHVCLFQEEDWFNWEM